MPLTWGRTSALMNAAVRPGSSELSDWLRKDSVMTPTSGGGGAAAAGLLRSPQPATPMASAARTAPAASDDQRERFGRSARAVYVGQR